MHLGGIIFGKTGFDGQITTTGTETTNDSRTFLEGEKDIFE
ncbi:hypothetical protein ACT7DA_23265 [Bacillus pacificus]